MGDKIVIREIDDERGRYQASHRRLTCLGSFPTSFNNQITSRSIYMNDTRLREYFRNTGDAISSEGS